ncbi:MAG: hypothetical protein EOP84_27275, partial [Verrucomicrobiaceae bacterium]
MLHISAIDVICGIAFGVAGGPPVIQVNHAAHVFWTGITVADLVVNCRGSALEDYWTLAYRGAPKCLAIPIPLRAPDSPAEVSAGQPACGLKEALGIPPASVIVLTVGASFKYLPANGLDFLETCKGFLREVPEAFLLVAGFEGDNRWKAASAELGGRIKTLGVLSQQDLASIHALADIYIEGFPFGTTTSLLEAGLRGVPVVLAPAECPPPYGSDGAALDAVLECTQSIEDYQRKVIVLCQDVIARKTIGEHLRRSVMEHHTGAGWNRYLQQAVATLPPEHRVYSHAHLERTPPSIHRYWTAYFAKCSWGYEDTLENAVQFAISTGLTPRVTKQLRSACRKFVETRAGRAIPLPILTCLCNVLLPYFPRKSGGTLFGVCAALCRGPLLPRATNKVLRRIRGLQKPDALYQEYRRPPGSSKLPGYVVNAAAQARDRGTV